MDDHTTARDLSLELDVSAKRIRDHLRTRYGLLATQQLTRWELTNEQVAEVRAHFASRTRST